MNHDYDFDFESPPVVPTKRDVPLSPTETWKEKNNPARLVKTYEFFDINQRNKFVNLVFFHEEFKQFYVQTTIANTQKHIRITISTQEAGVITELDKEFAKDLDDLYNEALEMYV